jgi:predicted nucleotidyltransferase
MFDELGDEKGVEGRLVIPNGSFHRGESTPSSRRVDIDINVQFLGSQSSGKSQLNHSFMASRSK